LNNIDYDVVQSIYAGVRDPSKRTHWSRVENDQFTSLAPLQWWLLISTCFFFFLKKKIERFMLPIKHQHQVD
jgi:hypothetical protein